MSSNPYKSEVIGSLLRPQYLKDAMSKAQAGGMTTDELRAVQDRAALDAIALQEACDLDIVTDGEVRRRGWTGPLTVSIAGYGTAPRPADYRVNWNRSDGPPPESTNGQAGQGEPGTVAACIAKLTRGPVNLPLEEMRFLKQHTKRPWKITLPSLAHASVFYVPGASDKVYPDKDDYMNDVRELTTQIVQECIDEGATYVQLDSPRYTHLVSEAGRENFRRLGIDPATWLGEVIAQDNALVDRFPGVTWGLHLCRGNGARGAWSVEGGYDPIAEQLFSDIHVDRLLLEYDTPRAGNFAPLRFVPKDKVAVLGLISTKENEVETPELLRARIEEATRYIPLEQISLSPQCGFASAFEGNMDEATQRAKLEVLSATVKQIWS
ncbi:MAG TPA: methionine synthase [Dehalococcoidia bacterium]|nr:methionine synthase [Dehalococcoidia bacterium]